jgi:hypothetical protein
MHRKINSVTSCSVWYKKFWVFLLVVAICAVAGEVTLRSFWHFKYHVPFIGSCKILYKYYPELRKVDTIHPTHSDDFYDVLLLGSSVFDKRFGTIEQELLKELSNGGHRKVRIHNFGNLAQSSRDSLIKYASVGEASFDLVVFYQGACEARANNVPPELFREDYSHYGWYKIVCGLAPYHGRNSFTLPYTFSFFSFLDNRIRYVINKSSYVPQCDPREEWLHYGSNYRSVASFESNLNAIVDLSLQRGDRLLLMTVAVHIPENYSLEAFKKHLLSYSRHRYPIESLGEPENVVGAVAAHNNIISHVVMKHPEILFADQANLMMGNPALTFDDPVHFTSHGSEKFVKNMLEVILPDLNNNRWELESSK